MQEKTQDTRLMSKTVAMPVRIIPTKATEEYLNESKTIKSDLANYKKAELLHSVIDEFIRQKIQEGLAQTSINYEHLASCYYDAEIERMEASDDFTKRNIYREALQGALTKAEKNINSINFDPKSAKFISEELREFIEKKSVCENKAELLEIIDNVTGLRVYLSTFMINRKRALVDAAERCLDNFEIYLSNIEAIQTFSEREEYTILESMIEECRSFVMPSYYEMLTSVEGIAFYNSFVNGVSKEAGTEIKGFNQLVNEVNAKNRSDKGYKGKYYKKINELHKQILMPREKQYRLEKVTSDEEAREDLNEVIDKFNVDFLSEIMALLKNVESKTLNIKGQNLHTLSHIVTGNHNDYPKKLYDYYESEYLERLEKARTKAEKKNLERKLEQLQLTLDKEFYTFEDIEKICGIENLNSQYYAHIVSLIANVNSLQDTIFHYDLVSKGTTIRGKQRNKIALKDYYLSLLELKNALRLINVKKYSDEQALFYNVFTEYLDAFSLVTHADRLYQAYITENIHPVAKKYPVVFGNSARAEAKWWTNDDGFLNGNENLLVKKDGKFYICFISAESKKLSVVTEDTDGDCFAMQVKVTADLSKGMPRFIINKATKEAFKDPAVKEYVRTEKVSKPFVVSRELYNIITQHLYKPKELIKAGYTYEEAMRLLYVYIDAVKEFTQVYEEFSRFDISFKDTREYQNTAELYEDMAESCIYFEWKKVSQKHIEALNEQKSLMMFELSTRFLYDENHKDSFSQLIRYTLSEENFEKLDCKLNSRPQFTFRPASIPAVPTHTKGSILVDKLDKNGAMIPLKIYQEIYAYLNKRITKFELSDKASALLDADIIKYKEAETDIIKNKRYSEDQLFVTFTITKNRTSASPQKAGIILSELNERVNLNVEKGSYTISVTRGYKNLIYVAVIDKEGNIVEHHSLNVINERDYAETLKQLATNKNESKSEKLEYSEKIASFKTSYLQLAASVIGRLQDKYNAVIILEKLDDKVKDKKGSLEVTAFKSFEKILVNKMSDLHFKERECNEAGSVNNPIQRSVATSQSSYNGYIRFINPSFTETVCPITGFTNLFRFVNIKTVTDRRTFLENFDSIKWDNETNSFRFIFSYKNFKNKRDEMSAEFAEKVWNVSCGGEYTTYDREKRCYNTCYRADNLKMTLSKYINIEEEITNQLESIKGDDITELYSIFISRLLSNRVVQTDEHSEYYVSPVLGELKNIQPDLVSCYNLYRKYKFISTLDYSANQNYVMNYLMSLDKNAKDLTYWKTL